MPVVFVCSVYISLMYCCPFSRSSLLQSCLSLYFHFSPLILCCVCSAPSIISLPVRSSPAKTSHPSDSPSCPYTSLSWACAPSFVYVVSRVYVADTLHATRICKMNHVWLSHMSKYLKARRNAELKNSFEADKDLRDRNSSNERKSIFENPKENVQLTSYKRNGPVTLCRDTYNQARHLQ